MEMKNKSGQEEVIMTACSSHCSGTCLLRVHIKDGVVTAIETDGGSEPQFRACPIGVGYETDALSSRPSKVSFKTNR